MAKGKKKKGGKQKKGGPHNPTTETPSTSSGGQQSRGKKGAKHAKGGPTSMDENFSSNTRKSQRTRGKKDRRRGANYSPNTPEDEKLRQSIESDGTRVIVDMEADGNCLFRSLSDQLYYDHGQRHADVRHEICDYLQGHEDFFSLFLDLDDEDTKGEDASDYTEYVSTMRQDGEWGGNLELVAAARLYRRRIRVFSITLEDMSIDYDSDKPPHGPEMLVSFHDDSHYNSVRDNSRGGRPPPPPQKTYELPEVEPSEEEETKPSPDSSVDGETLPTSESDSSGTTATSLNEQSGETPEGVVDKDTWEEAEECTPDMTEKRKGKPQVRDTLSQLGSLNLGMKPVLLLLLVLPCSAWTHYGADRRQSKGSWAGISTVACLPETTFPRRFRTCRNGKMTITRGGEIPARGTPYSKATILLAGDGADHELDAAMEDESSISSPGLSSSRVSLLIGALTSLATVALLAKFGLATTSPPPHFPKSSHYPLHK